MSTGRDDDALSWDGDDDPTLDAGASPASPSPAERGHLRRDAPRGEASVDRGDDPPPDGRPEAEPTPLGNAALVGIGMVAAAFILFSVGWLITSFRLRAVEGLPVPAVSLTAITLLAAAAPLVWFAAAYALTRRAKTWVRFAWLLAGVVLLVPWPFLVTGALA